MSKSKIEWTESTWNPITGCSKISDGCLHCYAEKLSSRLCKMGVNNYRNGFEVTIHDDVTLQKPLQWKKPQMIFVNSMSDSFHEKVPLEFIKKIFHVMNCASWHTFQVLTKRSERLKELAPLLNWHDNIWQGVTVENNDFVYRISHLRQVPAKVKFISMEPLLGPIKKLNLQGIDWVIVGGESGPFARPMKEEWVIDILHQCQAQNVKFFFKQWGGINKKKAGRLLLNKYWDEYPQS